MVKIYGSRKDKDGTASMRAIATDAKDLNTFEGELIDALLQLTKLEPYADERREPDGAIVACDLFFSLIQIIPAAFQIAFKLAGYKAERVHEQRVLIAGHSGFSMPDEQVIVNVGARPTARGDDDAA